MKKGVIFEYLGISAAKIGCKDNEYNHWGKLAILESGEE
jgi:hypothetical protein